MDRSFIGKYAPMYVQAAGLTLRIGGIGVALSLLLGFACCMIRYFRLPLLRQLAGAYIELARNTPLLVQLFFLYFGLPKIGVKISSEACAIIGLTFLGGAYMAEALRSGLEAVDRTQVESGMAYRPDHSAEHTLRRFAAGAGNGGSRRGRERDLSAEGDQRIQRSGAGRSDVCGEGSDRHVL